MAALAALDLAAARAAHAAWCGGVRLVLLSRTEAAERGGARIDGLLHPLLLEAALPPLPDPPGVVPDDDHKKGGAAPAPPPPGPDPDSTPRRPTLYVRFVIDAGRPFLAAAARSWRSGEALTADTGSPRAPLLARRAAPPGAAGMSPSALDARADP